MDVGKEFARLGCKFILVFQNEGHDYSKLSDLGGINWFVEFYSPIIINLVK